MIRTINPEDDLPKRKRFRPRSFKDRPNDVDGLVSALGTGRLDGRALAAKQILALREAFEAEPTATTRGLIADVLSINGALLGALMEAMTRPGVRLVDEEGEPHPLIAKHVPNIQRAILQASAALERLEGIDPEKGKTSTTAKSKRNPAPSEAGDVSALVLELSNKGE